MMFVQALTRSPYDYADAKAQAHVNVAQRMNKQYNMHYKQGDVVAFIICEVRVNCFVRNAFQFFRTARPTHPLNVPTTFAN
jgi:DNA polymerase elongation subunit (family B)